MLIIPSQDAKPAKNLQWPSDKHFQSRFKLISLFPG